ncbi:hypothetical protein ABGT15_04465 [Flavobacterium enshiense]|uniref:hypothetical protein n=1 Tax=Flavobacterium enshiense TaxID=1341165 RepID=UPI00345C70B2
MKYIIIPILLGFIGCSPKIEQNAGKENNYDTIKFYRYTNQYQYKNLRITVTGLGYVEDLKIDTLKNE